jgi:hypothetical protein
MAKTRLATCHFTNTALPRRSHQIAVNACHVVFGFKRQEDTMFPTIRGRRAIGPAALTVAALLGGCVAYPGYPQYAYGGYGYDGGYGYAAPVYASGGYGYAAPAYSTGVVAIGGSWGGGWRGYNNDGGRWRRHEAREYRRGW